MAATSGSQDITTQEPTIGHQDLLEHEVADGFAPPPAYGEYYGDISDTKNGTGNSARATDDGRVNVQINSLGRFYQVLHPALRQYEREIEQTGSLPPPPPTYTPRSAVTDDKNVVLPPSMNILIQVVGSRGDVQPFVALAKVLKNDFGHRVRIATHPVFREFVKENGLEFFSIGGDPSLLMNFMVKGVQVMKGDIGKRRKDVAEYIQGCWRSCYQAGEGMNTDDASTPDAKDAVSSPEAIPDHFTADCIIANPPSFAHIHCAEKLGIPLHIMFTMPYSPTTAFPHPLANIISPSKAQVSDSSDRQIANFVSYTMLELLTWQGLGSVVNRFRQKCLGLDPVSTIWAPSMLHRLKIPHTYLWSPALIPKPSDWGPQISVAGFSFLNLASGYTPARELQDFLDAGPPPVYIGFGSIVLDDPNACTTLIFDALRNLGQRVLLSKGWGGLGAEELTDVPDNVFMLGNVPHDWLFQRVSAVVHHGGAGTTAAGIAAGRPTLVVPFFGDQPFWGAMITRAGAGCSIPFKQLTAEKLAHAINFCLKPDTLARAKELAEKIATEQGRDTASSHFHQALDPEKLRCVLSPPRLANWRIKRTQIKLSAFAACTLANAGLLDFRDLKLFRPQEHYIDEGPLDPISGAFTAFVHAVGGMMTGLVDIPSETWRGIRMAGKTTSKKQHPTTLGSGSSSTNPTSFASDNKSEAASTTPVNPSASSVSLAKTTTNSQPTTDLLRPKGVHMTNGAGRFVKAVVQGPVDIAVSLTRGAHNIPRLWSDDTVRPQERVTDVQSGFRAVGREFGLGWYDGITGVVTQPWKGAQKGGASGFVKGVGKGLGGFIAKPTAACLGILSHTMQGFSKEAEKLFGNSVQSYIVASRAAQGYEEWLKSSDEDKEDVIARWNALQGELKKPSQKGEASRETSVPSSSIAAVVGDEHQAPQPSSEEELGRLHGLHRTPLSTKSSEDSLLSAGSGNENRVTPDTPLSDPPEASMNVPAGPTAIPKSLSKPSKVTNPRPISQSDRDSLYDSDLALDDAQDQHFDSLHGESRELSKKELKAPVASSSHTQHDPGHLAGITRADFEAQTSEGQGGEKTAQEKTEEQIVLEYVKKQSLLEKQHRGGVAQAGASTAVNLEDEEDEDLQKALKLSMAHPVELAG